MVHRIWDTIASYRRYCATRDELAALSDRQLNDIGLERADIDACARAAAHKPAGNAASGQDVRTNWMPARTPSLVTQ